MIQATTITYTRTPDRKPRIIVMLVSHKSFCALFASLLLLTTNGFSAIIGKNDYIPVDDNDLAKYPEMNEELKEIIRRTASF